MAKEVLTQERAKEILRERWEAAKTRITPEAIATGKHGERHEWQIRVLRCRKQNIILICSRRAGKSEVACGLILMAAASTSDVSCLYLGLTKDAAEPIWRKWKKLLKKLDIPHESSDSDQYTVFPNGSRVLFTGTDDLRRVSHLLGDQLAGGIAILDEGQSDPGIMETTVEDTLGPMLDETTHDKPRPGRLALMGTVPDAPVGYFWNTWIRNRNKEDTATKEGTLWETFAWNRFENPFQTDSQAREDAYCEKYNRSHDDPRVLRRFRGLRVWSRDSNAFRFDNKAHVYANETASVEIGPFVCRFGNRPAGFDRVIVGVRQPQKTDKFAIIAWSWDHRRKDRLLHVVEAVSKDDTDPLEHEWLRICAMIRATYPEGTIEFIRNPESSNKTNEALTLSHGITVQSAINETGAERARVKRLADLLDLGIAKVMDNSELAQDLSVAAWNQALRKSKKWELDDTKRAPEVAKAATYALDLPSYTRIGGMKPPPPRKSFDERLAEEHKKSLDALYNSRTSTRRKPAFETLWLPPPKISDN